MVRRFLQAMSFGAALLFFSTCCLGDIVILKKKDRRTGSPVAIEGKILELNKDQILMETSPGKTRSIACKDVRKVVRSKPPWEVYEQKKSKISSPILGYWHSWMEGV